jgi:hypothetical protein
MKQRTILSAHVTLYVVLSILVSMCIPIHGISWALLMVCLFALHHYYSLYKGAVDVDDEIDNSNDIYEGTGRD